MLNVVLTVLKIFSMINYEFIILKYKLFKISQLKCVTNLSLNHTNFQFLCLSIFWFDEIHLAQKLTFFVNNCIIYFSR